MSAGSGVLTRPSSDLLTATCSWTGLDSLVCMETGGTVKYYQIYIYYIWYMSSVFKITRLNKYWSRYAQRASYR